MPEQWPKMLKYASAGTEFVITFLGLLVGGIYLDRWAKTGVLFTLIGAAGGFALGMYRLVVQAMRAQKEMQDQRRDESLRQSGRKSDLPGKRDDSRKDKGTQT